MTLVVALASIEGSRKSKRPVIAPGSVFEASGDELKHLENARAIRDASKEDVAIAKANGMFVEKHDITGLDADASVKAAAEKAAADKAAAEKAGAEKAAADKAAAEKAAAEKAAAEKASAGKPKASGKSETKTDEDL